MATATVFGPHPVNAPHRPGLLQRLREAVADWLHLPGPHDDVTAMPAERLRDIGLPPVEPPRDLPYAAWRP